MELTEETYHAMESRVQTDFSDYFEQNPQGSEIVSSIFQNQCPVTQISATKNEEVGQNRISIFGSGQNNE